MYILKKEKLEQLRKNLQTDEKICENNFKDIVKNEFFLSSIALTNPNFYKEMIKGNKRIYTPGNNYSRTLFMYLERSSVKTSPLSHFTSTSYIKKSNKNNSSHKSEIYWNNKNILSLFLEIIKKYKLYMHFDYVFAPITSDNKTILFQPNKYVNMKWKNSDFISHNDTIKKLSNFVDYSSSYSYDSILDILCKSEIPNHFQYLFDVGVIKPILNFGLDSPFQKFAKKFANYMPFEISEMLINLDNLKNRLTNVICNNKKFYNLEEINLTLNSLKSKLSVNLHTPILFEDSSHQQCNKSINDIIGPEINTITNKVKKYMHINHIYEHLINFFKTYNSDYVNLIDFLFDFVNREKEFSKIFRESLSKDYDNPKKITTDVSNVHYHIFWQYQGDQIIINKVSLGNYELLHRFDCLFHETTFLNDLDKVFESLDMHNYKITFGEDISNIQILRNNNSNKVLTNLDYELSDREYEYLHIKDIFLTLQDGMLRFSDSSGELLNLYYSGSVPKHLNKSWCYIIQVLINPYYLYSDIGSNPTPFKKIVPSVEYKTFENNIIYRRKRMSFYSKDIYDILNNELEKSKIVIELYKYFKKNSIALESYIYVCDTDFIGMNKPIYFSVYNLYCIDILKNKITEDGIIVFCNCLPYMSDEYTFEYLTAVNGGINI
ncbi:hypothetical protein AB4Y49_08785 [Staphylococcus pseudintermedius]|uniref:hypothetical protein n=1 Tax=Staphylococcus pseudintermedius TaxID=283734 RepID=UPI000D735CE1|nr:hypothetical protein [Staphylococcus pseudintermedius]EGQ4035918.1 hypothetical protein [Staphylococcus pseudintermedius]EIK0300794.1 hypothetical protein [Staphylococcus pseudintermedius]ELI3943196.1 hypothetical protein [Staphylococcus pseudintermedius]EMB9455686.1 hypothetical protein [Staphylococcus pseudintermedius]MBM0331190.1 hypothetical protein [Staphylococcus pseudintermedius]